eukprot:6334230-Prymnesium_polylepis.1
MPLAAPPLLTPIARASTRAEFDAHVRRRRPVILSLDAAKAAAWATEVAGGLEGRPLPARLLPAENRAATLPPYARYFAELCAFTKLTVRKLTLQQCTASGQRWMVSGIHLFAPECSAQVLEALDELMPCGSATDDTGCWISSAGCQTDLHYDAFEPDNFHLVAAGENEIVLFAPHEAENIYCFGGPRLLTRFAAAVDPFRPDLQRFPLYANATGLRATLAAGDVVYIPAFWWHSLAHTGGFNISLTR